MSMIDEILEKGLGHLPGCPIYSNGTSFHSAGLGAGYELTCTCGADKRRKYLERLKEPDHDMIQPAHDVIEEEFDNDLFILGRVHAKVFKAMLAKAEEGL